MQGIKEPRQRPSGGDEPPRVIPPLAGRVFSTRAQRFARLADGHSAGDWLRFLSRLAEAQHKALRDLPTVPLPGAMMLAQAREYGMPPLSPRHWPRDEAWRAALRLLAESLYELAPEESRQSLRLLSAMSDDRLEELAGELLAGETGGAEAPLLPFVAAALEVYWTAMAARLGGEGIAPIDERGACPSCGFPPVASVVRIGDGLANLRYLHCPLCNTEWNMVRVTCAACEATEGVAYQQIKQSNGAVRAETCESCNSYLKIMYRTADPLADPVADDLATRALDVLVDGLGYQRAGPNHFFALGEG